MFASYVGPWGISSDYGWFHVYAFTMFFGMLVAILFSWYRLYQAKVPVDGLMWSVIFIIPASLFGGSFFGKNDPTRPTDFWHRFAFWEAGMSIHGGVLIGAIVGLIFFAFYKRKTKVSLWVYGDCIIPNILLGQVIGRWGNFFNHELLGAIVGYSDTLNASGISAISWLPAFIRDNAFQLTASGPEISNGLYVFRAPIFLYESVANLGFWAILTFLLPNAFRWFSKKPWKVEAKKYQLLTMANITTKRKGKNNKISNYFTLIHRNHKLKKKYWDEAFYHYKVDSFAVKELNQKYQAQKAKALKKHWFKDFFVRHNLIYQAYFARSEKLYHLNNPKNYFVLRSGGQMWLYFFGWNLIRFCLELQREAGDLFLKHRRTLDYAVLITIFVIGLLLAVLSQFVFARYFRNSAWTYEKEY